MERELRELTNHGSIGSIHKSVANTIEEICEIRKMVLEQLMESGLSNTSDDYQDGRESYKDAIEKYSNNT